MTVTAALGVNLLGAPTAVASRPVAPVASADRSTGGTPADPDVRATRSEAADAARRAGRRIEVGELRSESAQTFANPSGTFTVEQTLRPQRVKQAGKWVPVDATLRFATDGSVRPVASTVGMTFSGGGTGPLVELNNSGRKLGFTWDTPLPKPVLTGDTATYGEVLPGVDLVVVADVDSFTEQFVVKNAAAARDPRLARLTFTTRTTGVDVTTNADGTLLARDPQGRDVFTGSQPRMWDAKSAAGSTAAHAAAAGEPAAAPTTLMPARIAGGALEIIPDQSLLTGTDTVYPVVVDPRFGGAMQNWTFGYKPYPNSSFWNGANFNEGDGNSWTSVARVGHESDTGGTARSFFQMDTRPLWDTVISSSTFSLRADHSWSCTKKAISVYDTPSISSSVTWNNTTGWWGTKIATAKTGSGGGSSCPSGPVEWDVTNAARSAAANHWWSWSLGLRADDESTVNSWTKFVASSAVMSTEYNSTPGTPTRYATVPLTPCGVDPPYGSIGDTQVSLTSRVEDPDGGTVYAHFALWAIGDNPNIIDTRVAVSSGNTARLDVPANLLPSGTYSWFSRAEDPAGAVSAWTPVCHFIVDRSRPSAVPVVSSTKFTADPAVSGKARETGTFTFAANGVADIASYEYWSDWDNTHVTVPAPCPGCARSVDVRVPLNGPLNLYVVSKNAAGNASDTAVYGFWSNHQGFADKPGDLDGDGNTDLLSVRPDGRLMRYPGNGDGNHRNPLSSSETIDIDGAKYWQGNLMTRRGDWNGDEYEDVLLRRRDPATNTYKLYMHPNNGDGYICFSCSTGVKEFTLRDPANDHLQNADQILAIGNVTGDDTGMGGGFPDFLVSSGGQLWLYQGSGPSLILDYPGREPILIGTSGWGAMTLAAPGDVNGDTFPDLWARNKSTGELFLYPGVEQNSATAGIGVDEHRVLINTGLPLVTTPYVLATDANNDGKADYWNYVSTGNGEMYITWGDGPNGFSGYAQTGWGWQNYYIF
ncbi:VCBS repeat-containing protein [Embleya sp. NPDC056575]|uniref:VCBS repeat-containing protein n=1 Tax=unclassified Embleya TaxID=2699296 RepID=UPI00367F9C4F